MAAALPELARFAVALAGNPHDGKDLLQDGLVRLARGWDRVEVSGDVRAYTRTILVRLNLNRIRARGREANLLRRLSPLARSTSDDQPYVGLEPWLEEALQTLTPRQRTAIALVHLCGMTTEAAADLMSCRPNTLKTHLERGMARLRVAAATEGNRHGAAADSR
ncbi:RNA polymerase sigma factor [Nocardioides hungaricus]